MLFTGTAKLPNSDFRISKTTKLISTKFSYIFSALHIHYFTHQNWRKSLQHFLKYLFLKISQFSSSFSSSHKITNISRHTVVCQQPRKQKKMCSTQVCYVFTGTVKLLNSAFRISKTTRSISTKFIYFLPYICTTSHIKIKGNCSSTS